MGLDIYLYKCENREEWRRKEERYSAETDKLYKSLLPEGKDQLGDKLYAQYKKKAAVIAKKYGLDDDGERPHSTYEVNSKKHPDHYFKIGYFRSSYNSSGINSVADKYGLKYDLYKVFEVDGEQYEFAPDWERAKVNAEAALAEMKVLRQSRAGQLGIMQVDVLNVFDGPENEIDGEKKALDLYLENEERHKKPDDDDCSGYSNKSGNFFHGGIKVLGFVRGVHDFLARKLPCIYAVYEKDGWIDWYIAAYEIVLETIEYVLSQKDRDDFYFHWSG